MIHRHIKSRLSYYVVLFILIAGIAWNSTRITLNLLRQSHLEQVQTDASRLLLDAVSWCIENQSDLLEAPKSSLFEPRLPGLDPDNSSCLIIVTDREYDQATLFIRVESIRNSIIKTEKTSLVLSRDSPALVREENQTRQLPIPASAGKSY